MSESVGIINEDDEEEEEEEEDVVMVVSTSSVVHESSSAAAAAAIPAATVAAAAPGDFADVEAQPFELRPLPLDPRPALAPAENLQEPTVAVSMLLPPPGSDAAPMVVVGIVDEGQEEEEEEEAEKEEEQPAKEELVAESLDSVVSESQLRPSFEFDSAPARALFGEEERKSAQAPAPSQAEPAVGEISSSPPETGASAGDTAAKAPSSPPPRSGGGGIASKISHWVHSALGVPEDDEEQLRAARKQEHKSQKRA